MRAGVLKYWVRLDGGLMKAIALTLFEEADLGYSGAAGLRRLRLQRVMEEAERQGARLGYADMEMIFLVSRATLKRDLAWLRRMGRAASRPVQKPVEARP